MSTRVAQVVVLIREGAVVGPQVSVKGKEVAGWRARDPTAKAPRMRRHFLPAVWTYRAVPLVLVSDDIVRERDVF